MKRIGLLLLLSIMLSSSVFSGTIDPGVADQKYIEYGSKFKNIVKLCCKDPDGLIGCGSAVVIDKHWVITAAHVVNHCVDWYIKIDDVKYKIDKVYVHEEFKDSVFGKHDVALCYIQQEILMDFYPEIYDKNDEIGQVCSLAGWGFTGNFNTGSEKHDGKRRAGSNIIERSERSVLVCSPSRKGDKHTELEFLIASGDSGGGLFIGNKLAGIHSSVLAIDKKPNSTYTDESCHTRLSLYTKWIRDTITRHR